MRRATTSRSRSGFSLVEILLAMTILVVALVPMMLALSPANELAREEERTMVLANTARGTMKLLLATDYSALLAHASNRVDLASLLGSQAAADAEAVSVGGTRYEPAVGIEDASGGTGGLLRVVVQLDDVELEAWRADF